MKKRFKQADGTEVEIEGTAEEIAEYERKLREGTKPVSVGKKKPVLHGAPEVDGIPLSADDELAVRMKRLGMVQKWPYEWWPAVNPVNVPFQTGYWCSICNSFNCNTVHVICTTTTSTSDTLSVEPKLTS